MSQQQPETARSSQEQPRAASSSQEQPGAARSSQEQPGATRSSQEQPGAARSSQEQPAAARSSQEQPGAAAGAARTQGKEPRRVAGKAGDQTELTVPRGVWGSLFRGGRLKSVSSCGPSGPCSPEGERRRTAPSSAVRARCSGATGWRSVLQRLAKRV